MGSNQSVNVSCSSVCIGGCDSNGNCNGGPQPEFVRRNSVAYGMSSSKIVTFITPLNNVKKNIPSNTGYTILRRNNSIATMSFSR